MSAAAESFLIKEFCANVTSGDPLIPTFYTLPLEILSLFPCARPGGGVADSFDPTWLREKRYSTYHAASYLAASNNTLRDLHEVYDFSNRRTSRVVPNGVASNISSCGRGRCRRFQEKSGK